MIILVVTICGLVILLAFEIRHREVADRLTILEEDVRKLGQENQKIREEMKKKKNVYEEYKPPSL